MRDKKTCFIKIKNIVMKKIIWILILLPIIIQSQSLDTNVFKYFPLSVGNRWTWYIDQYWDPGPGYETMKIQSTINANNRVYFAIQQDVYYFYQNQHFAGNSYYRIDSSNGNLYSFNLQYQTECLIDSLNSKKIDSAQCTCSGHWDRCDTGSYNIFGLAPRTKIMGWTNYFEAGGQTIYALGFGRVYEREDAHTTSTQWYLRGCLINGILYGDTSVLVGIQNISSEVPKSYSLFQNYPNPFNPTTKIKFDVPNVMNSRDRSLLLIIYDALGREVATLVNEQLQPGSYEVEWDASNYPSGVYFYKLEAGSFSQTKKLVLIK
jgi:hypothetical protein